MISTNQYEASRIFLGKNTSADDAYDFFSHFAGGRSVAFHDNLEQRNVDAYLAFQALNWDWPFDKPLEISLN